MKTIPYGRQNISNEDIEAVVNTLQSDFLTQGPKISEFESKFAEYVGSKYAVAVSNGTAALHLSAMAMNVDNKTNVITTPITFVASANCIKYCGGNIYFADIDPNTLTISLESVKKLIESKPKGFFHGIIPVDFTGYPVNLEEFKQLANQHNLWIIEDACHAPGAYFIDSKGEKQISGNGKFAQCSIFSFHPVKHIATGEGGMITTNDDAIYKKLLQLRSHGMVYQGNPNLLDNHGGWYMEMQTLGYNYRLCDIQAALGISQLNKADAGLIRRNEIADRYDTVFKNSLVKTLDRNNKKIYHAFHLYVVQVEDRKRVYDELRKKNIFTQIHYIPVHTMPYYKQFESTKGNYPVAESYYQKCLSLPMYPTLTNEEQDYVIDSILEIINN